MAKKKTADKPEKPAEAPKAEPSDVNSSLASDRMKALLEEHRAMGVRPK